MTYLGRIAAIVVLASQLAACDLFESFTEMNRQLEKVATMLEREFGSRPSFSWNIKNGVLVDLTVHIDAGTDENRPVGYFIKTVATTVSANVERKPQSFFIAFAVK